MQPSFADQLRLFNSHSRDPEDHFKLVHSQTPPELRLCSSHPRFITCTYDDEWIHVHGNGPERLRLRLSRGSAESLPLLLGLLRERREGGGELLDWELEDWVGAGNPCRLWERRVEGVALDLGADSLWCVDLFPNIEARLVGQDSALR